MIAVVDYKAGNLRSVANALAFIGAKFFISGDADKLFKGDKLLFPGVGHAKSAMENLKAGGLSDMIKDFAARGGEIFGICLGSQILLDRSEEGGTECLGIIEGEAKRFAFSTLKVPQIGWNSVYRRAQSKLFDGIPQGAAFYFVHSYYTVPKEESHVLCGTDYGGVYASGVIKDNVAAVQFHPERSGRFGLKMLENFAK